MMNLKKLRSEIETLSRFKDVQNLKAVKAEVNRVTAELKNRGEAEVQNFEKTFKQVRTRVLKLRTHLEKELAAIHKIVKTSRSKVKKTSGKKRSPRPKRNS